MYGKSCTARVKVALPVPAVLIALIATFVVPVTVGVPLIKPVLVLTLKPAGKFVVPKLAGLLLAVIWKLNGIFVDPVALNGLVISGERVLPNALMLVRKTIKVMVKSLFIRNVESFDLLDSMKKKMVNESQDTLDHGAACSAFAFKTPNDSRWPPSGKSKSGWPTRALAPFGNTLPAVLGMLAGD